jgi:hypothetical protein
MYLIRSTASQAEAAIAKARENKELQAQIRAEALERDSKLVRVRPFLSS